MSLTVPLAADGAEDHLTAGARFLVVGNPADAVVELQSALETYRRTKNGTGEVVALMVLATAQVNLSNESAGRGSLQAALKVARKRNDVFGRWLVLIHLAQLERATGHYGAALAAQDDAKKVLVQAEDSDDEFPVATFELLAKAYGLPGFDLLNAPTGYEDYVRAILLRYVAAPLTHNGSAGILIETGQYERAEKELNAASAGPNRFAEGIAFCIAANFGELRFRQRRFAEARIHYQSALSGPISTAPNLLSQQWVAVDLYNRMAALESAENHLDEALVWNDRALHAVQSAGNQRQESAVLEERGSLLMQSNRMAEAEAAFRQALEIAVACGDDRRQVSIEKHLVEVSFLAGRYGDAAAHVEETIRLQQTLYEPVDEGLSWANLAVLYALMSNDDAADALLSQAHELAERSPVAFVCDVTRFLQTLQRHRKGTATKNDLSAAFRDLTANPFLRNFDVHGDAERVLRETLSVGSPGLVTMGPNHPIAIFTSLTYANEAQRQLDDGNTAAARRLFEKALEAYATGELRARVQAAIGACHWRDGNIDAAVRSFSDAAATLDTVVSDLRAEPMLISFLGSNEHRAYYDILVEALLRDRQPEIAFEVTERARARAFLRTGDDAQPHPGSTLEKKIREMELELEQWDTAPVPGETLDGLRQRYEVLRARGQSTSPSRGAHAGTEAPSLAKIWEEIPDDTTLISYFVSRFGAHAWVIDSESIEHVDLTLNDAELKRITCWATELGRKENAVTKRGVQLPSACGTDPASAEEAYATLIEPLRDKIRKKRLMIVPHGDLHLVPFAALYDPQRERYLIEDFTIVYLPSASALALLRNRESTVKGRALVMGDPDESGSTALSGANREVKRVATMLNTEARIGQAASEARVYGIDGDVDLLHIAAHGIYDPVYPSFSAINLAASGEWNGRLTVNEIRDDVDLSGVNLVVVSACQSGMGQQSGGDDVVGLTRALLVAGSPGVISALWKIDDMATTLLIEKFYETLLAGAPTATALRDAQLSLLRDERYNAPHFWAAFLLTGDPTGEWTSFRNHP